jgi:hypothetical protein
LRVRGFSRAFRSEIAPDKGASTLHPLDPIQIERIVL